MSAIDQYIKLYRDNAAAFDAMSAGALNAMRRPALESLEGKKLPTRRTEGYERTSLEEMYAPDLGINLNRINMPVDVASTFRCAVPHMSTLLGIMVNDIFHPTARLDSQLPAGVRFMSLARAASECPELVDRYYATIAPLADTPVALNTLLAQDGVLIHVSRGTHLSKPLQLVNILSSATPLLSVRRLLVVVEEDASLQLVVCDHTSANCASSLTSRVTEIHIGAHSRVEICDMEESSADTSRNAMTYCRQEEGSELRLTTATLTCGTTRNDYIVDLKGPNATVTLAGMAIAGAKMHIDNDTMVRHLAPNGKSDQLFRYVVDDSASGSFEGSIIVTPDAPFTEAYQSNRNILGSQGARMHSKPLLEIYNDEVKCSHGATTGQLDSTALFYMQSRGIPLDEARTMLMQAFMADVIDKVRVDGLNDRLRHLVERRFARACNDNTGACIDCQQPSL